MVDSAKDVVYFVQSQADKIRNGKEVIFDNSGTPERWKLIDYPSFVHSLHPTSHYAVSTEGRLMTNGGRVTDSLYCAADSHGYPEVGMGGDSVRIHRIVAWTFLGPDPSVPGKEMTVDHIDGNPRNNKLSNLRWTTWDVQRGNIGLSKYSPTKPRVLKRKPENTKMDRKKPEKKKPRSLVCYDCYKDGMGVAEIAEFMEIDIRTVEEYIYKQYQASDAGLLREKLGVTLEEIESTYYVIEGIKTLGDDAPKGEEYDRIVFKCFGKQCTNKSLAKKVNRRLYYDLVVG